MNETPKNEASPGFWLDAVACWHRLPNKLFFFALLAAWLALFQFLGNSLLGYVHTHSLFAWLSEAYNSPNPATDDGHGNLIPFVVVGLFWWKRKALLALPLRVWWPGILLVAFAALLHVAGYVVQQPRLSVLAMFTGLLVFEFIISWKQGSLLISVYFFAYAIVLARLESTVYDREPAGVATVTGPVPSPVPFPNLLR